MELFAKSDNSRQVFEINCEVEKIIRTKSFLYKSGETHTTESA